MTILAIDPGPIESGYVIFDGTKVLRSDVLPNNALFLFVKYTLQKEEASSIAVEMIASYGMPVGAEVFETCVVVGQIVEMASYYLSAEAITRVFRKDVKLHLCGTSKAKDGNIRQALIDKLGPQGTKKQPGPLYGVKSHAWAALAVAVTALRL
jgi:hypothetical protein